MSTTWRSLRRRVLAASKSNEIEAAPHPVAGVDLRSLPISPEEAFVMSRVDGRAKPGDIALATGLGGRRVGEVLRRLAELGALTLGATNDGSPEAARADTEPAPPRPDAPPPPVEAPLDTRVRISAPIVETIGRRPAPSTPYDPAELEEDCELSPDVRKRVLDLFYRIPKLNHYSVLGVSPSADKKEIKSAYFKLVSELHPDRYFGKNLGSFKTKLEKCFQRVTDAHDTLTRKKTRREYDLYLESRGVTSALDRLSDPETVNQELQALQTEMEAEARRSATQTSLPPANTPPPSIRPIQTARPTAVPARPSLTDDERRRALARKLRTTTRPSRPSRPPPSLTVEQRRQAAGEALRTRYETRLRDVVDKRLQRFLDQADEAERAGNMVAAANALRIAVQLSPDSQLLNERLVRTEQQASEILAEKYLEQAKYEEQNGYLVEAAQSYQKALRGRRTGPIYERAALCLLKADGDLRLAGELAKSAVDLEPSDVGYRITLATIYAKAGMENSAMAELERAKTLEPSNDTIKELIKRLRRGDL